MDTIIHRLHMANILSLIAKEPGVAKHLIFKGGTALYLFYHLSRFSVDLDFSVTQNAPLDKLITKISDMLSSKYEILDQSKNRLTLYWLVRYQSGARHLKIEISTRSYPEHCEPKIFMGETIQIMTLPDMMTHKLVAVLDRKHTASRDLFDAHFFLSKYLETTLNQDIIKLRSNISMVKFFDQLIAKVSKFPHERLLVGLGELVEEPQKDWIKAKLIPELVSLLRVKRSAYDS